MPAAGATSSGAGGVSEGGKNPGTGGVSVGTGGTIADNGGSSSVQGGSGGTSKTGGSGGVGGTAGIAGTAGTAGTAGECTPPTSYANLFVTVSGKTQTESDQKVATAWSTLFNPGGSGTIYFNGPGADESYVKDIYNNDVRSEGMSYGMIAAVQLNHQAEFDRLWTWVKNHMANGTGEIRWSCKTSGSGCAGGGAPDGEEYMATA
ncbi:MAG TPA: glycosyl hydrolase family 8, partial [Polyangiaceae bacterium]|nr:glycosyl hydrolase family 8 [Polyangiaceae bacterium]